MKITNKINDIFISLDYGTVFIYNDNVYMRTQTIGKDSDAKNAINLKTGAWSCFPLDTEVKKVDAELVIR